jgi:hypothetical protein
MSSFDGIKSFDDRCLEINRGSVMTFQGESTYLGDPAVPLKSATQ